MKILNFTILLGLLSAVCSAECSAESTKAPYIDFLDKSLFPLQDQIRFFGKKIMPPTKENSCLNADGATGIYNLHETDGALSFDCFGTYNVSCGESCFHDGSFLGKYLPEIECAGKIEDVFADESENSILEKRVCKDEKERVVWQRLSADDYVFDTLGNLIFYKDAYSTSYFRNNTLQRRFYSSSNEVEYYDRDDPDAFFHVVYKLNGNGQVIRETHLNKEGYPYYIYNAEYINGKCVKITKTDSYNHKTETFEFE